MTVGYLSDVVGQTPLIKIKSLSDLSGCHIYGKAEFLNPGGSVKDRTAKGIVLAAEKSGELKPGYTIVEGTAGNTGIGLATIAPERGYRCLVVMPNNLTKEKYDVLEGLGVEVVKVAPCPFSDQNHFYHAAKRIASERPNCFWANQFENMNNMKVHYETTGPEIWSQMQNSVDAFISASGTGGTIAGVSRFLKEKNNAIHVRLADPAGSGLYSFLKTGTFASNGTSMTEGIGIMRMTANFKEALVDEAVQVSDQDMISMLYHLARHDGVLVGTSSAVNVFAAYKYAMENRNSGKRIVTMFCDSALRYQSRVFNPDFLRGAGLVPASIY